VEEYHGGHKKKKKNHEEEGENAKPNESLVGVVEKGTQEGEGERKRGNVGVEEKNIPWKKATRCRRENRMRKGYRERPRREPEGKTKPNRTRN